MTRRLFIHAGAHRTGSSSFQFCLHVNRHLIAAAGFDAAYPGRDGVPSGTLRLRLPSPGQKPAVRARGTEAVREALARHNPDPGRPLILSEENILGRVYPFLRGAFYPAAEERLAALRNGLDGAEITRLLLVVRDYATFFPSAYRLRAETHAMPRFEEVQARYLEMDRGWPDLVTLLRDMLQPDEFVVTTYEHRGKNTDLLSQLVPDLAGEDLQDQAQRLNQQIPDAAFARLQDIYRAGRRLTARERQRIIDESADVPRASAVTSLREDVRATLEARYARDLDQIAAMQNVRLLR